MNQQGREGRTRPPWMGIATSSLDQSATGRGASKQHDESRQKSKVDGKRRQGDGGKRGGRGRDVGRVVDVASAKQGGEAREEGKRVDIFCASSDLTPR
jgi:hypothetical protein